MKQNQNGIWVADNTGKHIVTIGRPELHGNKVGPGLLMFRWGVSLGFSARDSKPNKPEKHGSSGGKEHLEVECVRKGKGELHRLTDGGSPSSWTVTWADRNDCPRDTPVTVDGADYYAYDIDVTQPSGVDWLFQPESVTDDVDEVSTRPDDVKGSWAIYYSQRGNILIGDQLVADYETGKYAHAYRCATIDGDTNKTWCKSQRFSDTWRILIPKAVLDSGTLPITLDPNFGYESIGGTATTSSSGDYIFYRNREQINVNGTWTSSNWYIGSTTTNAAMALYTDNSNAPSALVGNTSGAALSGSAWNEMSPASAPAVTDTSYYWNALGVDDACTVYYDSADASYYRYTPAWTYGSWPDPVTPGSSAGSRIYSCYFTITASSTGHPAVKRMGGVGFAHSLSPRSGGTRIW